MREAHGPGRGEGWREDPFGRHELRFFDGAKWTPYVRDGETNGMDEPGGPMAEEGPVAGRSGLLSEPVLVVERHVDLGRRHADLGVRRADGTQAAVLRQAALGTKQQSFRALRAREEFKNDALELVDDHNEVVLTLLRPLSAPKTTVVVRDHDGRDAGRISQHTVRSGATTFALIGPNGAFLGDLQAANWAAWDLWVQEPRGRKVATITRDWSDLDKDRFLSPDDYVVQISQPVPEPLRTLVVAVAVGLEAAIRPDVRGV